METKTYTDAELAAHGITRAEYETAIKHKADMDEIHRAARKLRDAMAKCTDYVDTVIVTHKEARTYGACGWYSLDGDCGID